MLTLALVNPTHRFQVLGGANIQDAITQASINSRSHNATTEFIFNGVLVIVEPASHPEKVLQAWNTPDNFTKQVGP